VSKDPYSRIATFSLPAEHLSSYVLCKFIRDMADPEKIDANRLTELQQAAMKAFDYALIGHKDNGEGRVALKINVSEDDIVVDIKYLATHFPPEEVFCKS
jgi:hypothetical protein